MAGTDVAEIRADFDYRYEVLREVEVSIGTTAGPKGWVYLGVDEQWSGRFVTSWAHLSPNLAREVAVRLLDAADIAEQELLGRKVSYVPLDITFTATD